VILLYNSSQPSGTGTGMLKEKKENKTVSGLTSAKVLYNSSKLSGTDMRENEMQDTASTNNYIVSSIPAGVVMLKEEK
jgi:hypothetical protein